MTDTPHTLLVCGGRDYFDAATIYRVLDRVHRESAAKWDTVRHGAQRGADTIAGKWALSRGLRVDPFPAEWTRLGKAAGPIRNQAMIDAGGIVGCVAFPGRIGTPDMVKRCKAAGIEVYEVRR